jgi:hypothetical protein
VHAPIPAGDWKREALDPRIESVHQRYVDTREQ